MNFLYKLTFSALFAFIFCCPLLAMKQTTIHYKEKNVEILSIKKQLEKLEQEHTTCNGNTQENLHTAEQHLKRLQNLKTAKTLKEQLLDNTQAFYDPTKQMYVNPQANREHLELLNRTCKFIKLEFYPDPKSVQHTQQINITQMITAKISQEEKTIAELKQKHAELKKETTFKTQLRMAAQREYENKKQAYDRCEEKLKAVQILLDQSPIRMISENKTASDNPVQNTCHIQVAQNENNSPIDFQWACLPVSAIEPTEPDSSQWKTAIGHEQWRTACFQKTLFGNYEARAYVLPVLPIETKKITNLEHTSEDFTVTFPQEEADNASFTITPQKIFTKKSADGIATTGFITFHKDSLTKALYASRMHKKNDLIISAYKIARFLVVIPTQ